MGIKCSLDGRKTMYIELERIVKQIALVYIKVPFWKLPAEELRKINKFHSG
jgi:hypothetical protein